MGKLPAIQFYPGDWLGDLGVRSLTLEERGVWIDLLCFMHKSDDRGKLVIAGRPMSDEEIAGLLGCEVAKLKQLVQQILSKGVASRDEAGALINRRMVSDERLRKTRASVGALGGHQKATNRLAKRQAKPTPSSSVSVSSSSSKQKTTEAGSSPAHAPKSELSTPPKPYEITTPLQKVVCGWKVVTGYAKDDRDWDKAHWARTAKSAKALLDFFRGDWKAVVDCCQSIREQMEKNKLSCTIETVLKHAADWKVKMEAKA